MMNKTIHYCWFGNNPKPKLIQKCIESWKKYCPDYEIKEWNETNFDVNICLYVEQAYQNKKWAFVSDFARFWVLSNEGGVYLDTDVELIKPLDDFLVKPFLAFETATSVATGLVMYCKKGDELCRTMIDEYMKDRFVLSDGNLNLRTVCDRVTDYLVERGLKLEDKTQNIAGYTIYDTSYFNPIDMDTMQVKCKENTVSIHHYAGTWVPKKDKFRGKVYSMLCRMFGKNCAEKIRKILGRK